MELHHQAAARPADPIRLYRAALSGHSHRVELFLSLLGLPFKMIEVDLANGEHTLPAFLALNPLGEVPVIDDNGLILADSNAILLYLARAYGGQHWIPSDHLGQARLQQWLSRAAGPLFNGPCAARLVTVFGAPIDHARAKAIATRLFDILEREFADRSFALGEQPSLADVASYTYIAHAPEGGVALDAYPRLRAWLARVESLPGFVPMQRTEPAGLGA